MNLVSKLKYKINAIVALYVAMLVLYQSLWLIAPVKLALSNVGIGNKFSYVLASLGFILLLFDLFSERVVLKGAYIEFLIATVAVFFISSIFCFKYSIANNVKTIIWQSIQMFLVYTLYHRISKEHTIKFLKVLHAIVCAAYILAILISLYQFIVCKSYSIIMESGPCRQGFQEGRLFGLFVSIYHASVACLILCVSSIYFAFTTKKLYIKIVYMISSIILFIYIVLSKTRSVKIACLIGVLVSAFVIARNMITFKTWKFNIKSKTILCILISLMSVMLVKTLYIVVLEVFNTVQIISYDKQQSKTEGTTNTLTQDRPDTSSNDVSNHRFVIWKDYIDVTSSNLKSLLVGLSPGSYMNIIKDTFPDLYIVRYISDNYPEMFNNNLIYDTHNAYLSIYVSSGIIGVIAMGCFLFLFFRSMILYFFKNKNLSGSYITLLTILVIIMVSVFFDSDLFFRCTTTSVVFWMIAGFMTKTIGYESKALLNTNVGKQ